MIEEKMTIEEILDDIEELEINEAVEEPKKVIEEKKPAQKKQTQKKTKKVTTRILYNINHCKKSVVSINGNDIILDKIYDCDEVEVEYTDDKGFKIISVKGK